TTSRTCPGRPRAPSWTDGARPSPRSPMRSSAGRSRPGKAGPPARSAPGPGARRSGGRLSELLDGFERSQFPPTLYLQGPSEPVKAAFLSELRHSWARHCPEAPLARVLRAAESSVEEILAAYQGTSLFVPRELIEVLDLEDLGRSDKRVAALAHGLARPAGG